MNDEVVTYDVREVKCLVETEGELAVQAGLKILDTVKDIINAGISEKQATDRIRLQMRALTKVNQDRCATIVEACREYSRCYGEALRQDAEAAQDCRNKAHEIIMYCIKNNIAPDNAYLEVVRNYLNISMATPSVDALNKGSLTKTLERGLTSVNDGAGQSVKTLTQFVDG